MSQLCDLIGVAVILKNNQYLKFESGLDNEYQVELSRYTSLFKNATDIDTVIEGIKYGFVGRGKKDPQEFWKYFKGLGDTEGFKSFSNDLIKIGIDQISQIVLWADEDKQSWRAYRWINYDINSGLITVGSAGSLIKGYHAEKSAWSCIRDAFPNIKSAWEDKPKKKPTSKYTYKFWTKFKNNVMALENKNPREDGFYVYDNIIYDYDYKENLNFFHHGENDFTVPAGIVGIKAVAAIDKYHDTFFNFPGDVFENFTITTDLQYLDAGDFFFNGINNLKVIDSKTGELLFQTKAFKEASTLLYEREKFKQFCELLPTSDWDAIQALFKRKSSASAKSTKAKIEISEEHRIEIPFPHDYYRNMLRDDGAEEFVIEKDSIYGTVLRIYTGAASHVIIPNGVSHISEKAFSNSKTLKKIEFSNPVSIGEKAFENCINLEEIIIDARISGSKNIFWGCTSVKKVNITNNAGLDYPILHSFYEDLPTIAFNHYKGGYYIGSETNPYRVLVKYNDEKIEEAIIAPDVEMVYTLAFRGCDLFKKVIIPEGMTAIDDSAFRSCKSLKEIVWPSTLVSIEARAFCECSSLETITIPQSVKKIAKDAFSACQKLQTITISDGAEYIGDLTFANCENLKYVIIPDSVKRIRSNSFENSPNVVIVSNSEYAERYAKKNNIAFQRLQDFETGSSNKNDVVKIDKKVPSAPVKIETPTEKTILEDFVVSRGILKQYNGKDSEVVIPETVTKIGERAFKDNKKLKAVALHDGIVRIDGGAFWGCTSLQSIVIPDSVAKIDWGTFNECSALKEVTIGKGVTNIGERAFRNCKALKNLFVPDTVTYFGVSAFDGCGSLTITGYANSKAEKYALANGIKFKRIVVEDKPVPQAEVTVSNTEVNREEELRKIREDNERRVREDQERQARIEAEERKKREEEEVLRKAREAEQGVALEEAYRKAQEDAARRAALVAERRAREEEERKKREEIERICREAEERKAQEEAERERKLREEEERKAREEAARKEELRKIQEENERRIREDQERIAREQVAIRKREEEARRAREEAERKAREEAERLEKLKAERRSQKVCQHCGGKFKGLFTKTCSSCGKKKDY